MSAPRATRIVILGGGFGGVYTAIGLERALRRELDRGEVELALVSRDNYMVFQPMLPEVISGSIGLLDTIAPIRRLCPRTDLYTRAIEHVDLAGRRVVAGAGLGSSPVELPYDHLVIALGNVTSFAGQPGLAEHALPFKYLGDALALRNHVLHALEEADIERDAEARRGLLTFVVAGGGFSGVEAVAELNDFVRAAARSYRNVRAEELRVVLLHAGPLILPELPPSLAAFAQRLLARRGVEIRLETRLAGATAEAALLGSGERISTRTPVSTVPAGPNPVVAALPLPMERGRIRTGPTLEVPGHPGVWALGACAHVVDPRSGRPCPPSRARSSSARAITATGSTSSSGARSRCAGAWATGRCRCAGSGRATASARSRSWATTCARPRRGASRASTCSRWTGRRSRRCSPASRRCATS